ncbi:hypothetical protein ICM05_05645 [Leucobacter sp. cx-42]|uniref:hypothetical protein n=1 Tax=unclassified Leucobacter TaxID=2621730 RepID=UPI00165DB62E|nr:MULTISPECIES: hypothetical protein [unclassified Leucobacter]MBC9954130.1 hypothetical protein [Leucobacter sp. cx-42]
MRDRNWKREAIASAISWLLLGTMLWLVNLNLGRGGDAIAGAYGGILQPHDLLGLGPIIGIIVIAVIAFASRAITVKMFLSRGGYFVVDLVVLLVGVVLASSVSLLLGPVSTSPADAPATFGGNLMLVGWVSLSLIIRLAPIVCVAVVISLFISSIWGTGKRTEVESA